MDPKRRIITRAFAALAAPTIASPAFSQAERWPSRPIKLVAPSAPGGATDVVGRILGRTNR